MFMELRHKHHLSGVPKLVRKENHMRFFLYTYTFSGNYQVSVRAGVFGTKRDRSGLPTKVGRLKRDDLVLIRDGLRPGALKIQGCCRVTGSVFDHSEYSPYRDFLWKDELLFKRVIYPLRVPVDFEDVPELNLEAITWEALDALSFRGSRGQTLKGRDRWANKFKGNFIGAGQELSMFSELLGISVP
jgi:hypothetical protein